MAARVSLEAITLTEARLEVHEHGAGIEMEADVRVKSAFEVLDGRYDVVVGVWLRLVPVGVDLDDSDGEEEQIAVLEVIAEHQLRYRLPDGFEASDEELDGFVQQSAILAAWPYARETIQGLAAKAGFPQVTLPIRKVSLPAPQRPAPAAKKATSAPAKKRTAAERHAIATKAAGARKRASRTSKTT